eukprot:5558339-Alexandrium_andersonii.AAC.1
MALLGNALPRTPHLFPHLLWQPGSCSRSGRAILTSPRGLNELRGCCGLPRGIAFLAQCTHLA